MKGIDKDQLGIEETELYANGFENVNPVECTAQHDTRHLWVPVQFFDFSLALMDEEQLRRNRLEFLRFVFAFLHRNVPLC